MDILYKLYIDNELAAECNSIEEAFEIEREKGRYYISKIIPELNKY